MPQSGNKVGLVYQSWAPHGVIVYHDVISYYRSKRLAYFELCSMYFHHVSWYHRQIMRFNGEGGILAALAASPHPLQPNFSPCILKARCPSCNANNSVKTEAITQHILMVCIYLQTALLLAPN